MKNHFLQFTNVKMLIFLDCLVALSTGMIIYTVFRINAITNNQSANYDTFFRFHAANDLFRQGTDLLTEAVRRYVVTMKPEYIEQYFDEALRIRHRDRALEMVRDLPIDKSLKDTLSNAMRVSKSLMDTEYHAMHLIAFKSTSETLHREVKDYPLTPEEQKLTRRQREKQAEQHRLDETYSKNKIEIEFHLADVL